MLEPYLSDGSKGELIWTREALVEAISRSHAAGFQTHIHAIGDAGVAAALEAIELADKSEIYFPVIAHAELTSSELLAKASALNVNLCVQPFWAQYNGLLLSCQHHLGADRLGNLYAFRDMIDSGANVSFSSDWPVSTANVLRGITTAVFRTESKEVTPHNPTQAITFEEAVDAYTINSRELLDGIAESGFNLGSLFDAVILDKNLAKENLDGFQATKVISVYKAGIDLLVQHHH